MVSTLAPHLLSRRRSSPRAALARRRGGPVAGWRVASVALVVVCLASAPTSAAATSAAATAAMVHPALACACFEGSELTIDKDKSIAPEQCACPYAADVRRDLLAAVAQVPAQHRADRVQVALAIEQHFLTRSPDYERMLRYDAKRYAWFLQNVRCTCEGCKATVYFSNCQLSCAPAVVYKRRARIWLAMGFSTDELITYYLNEHNATHSAREQIEREWLLPKRQRRRGWMVPALLIIGAIIGLGLILRRTIARSDGGRTADPASSAGQGAVAQAAGSTAASEDASAEDTSAGALSAEDASAEDTGAEDAAAGSAVSRKDRDRVLDALDDIEQDGGW